MFRYLAPALVGAVLLPAGPAAGQTVESAYRGLSAGPLRHARLVSLPAGTLLRFGTVRLTQQQLSAEMAKAEAASRAELKKHQFFVLERRARNLLLAAEAAAWAKLQGKAGLTTDEARLQAYVQSIVMGVTVTDAEARAFHAANQDVVDGADYESVAPGLKEYLLNEKRQAAVTAHVNTLSKRTPVEVDAAWCKAQAAVELDNPVDRVRRSGKPALVDFGSKGCRPCDMLAPILDELRKTYAGRCAVLFVQVTENQVLAARYGVSSIPVQIFFDKDGREVSRHVGFYPRDQLVKRMAAAGVK